jgi:hypothetical protein
VIIKVKVPKSDLLREANDQLSAQAGFLFSDFERLQKVTSQKRNSLSRAFEWSKVSKFSKFHAAFEALSKGIVHLGNSFKVFQSWPKWSPPFVTFDHFKSLWAPREPDTLPARYTAHH